MLADVDSARSLALRALARFHSGGEGTVTFVKYRENYVFKVDEKDGSYALRIHRGGYRSDAEILEELDLLGSLADVGVPVPRVRPALDGRLLVRVADEDGDEHQVSLLEWVPGAVPLGDIGDAFTGEALVEPDTFAGLGALVAELHSRTARLPRAKASVRPPWDVDGILGERAVWGDPRRAFTPGTPAEATMATALPLLDAALRAYGTGADRYGAIHADFTPENVLVADGRMTVIDFDDSGDGYYLFDLATAAFFYLPHPRADEVVSALLTGYRRVRALGDEDLAMWPALLLARGLTYLGWAVDRPGDETSEFILEHVRPLVVELAEKFVTARAGSSRTPA
ncbi:phosphotransferase enzyme family protein [Streptomyces sp. NPDC048282]|uniref:phosphotransferase enzyme family protein n=1 Tax=Streptomyces sp. NPDC048282 TaxID=3365528 RepID=UPI00371446BE